MAKLKGFKFGMLNARSLWPNIKDDRINLRNFDVLCIYETWLNASITVEMIAIHGYTVIRQD